MVWDIAIIGGGPGGYTAAIRGAQLGAKVLLIEEALLGGTCLNRGCIPTKTHYAHARAAETVKRAGEFGIELSGYKTDFAQMRSREKAVVSQLREGIQKLLKANGVEFIRGKAVFKEPGVLQIEGSEGGPREERAKNVIVASGSLPATLGIPGIDLKGVVTSDELLSLERVPSSLVIIGGGVIGIEWAGIFNALGSRVCVLEYLPRILPGFDTEITSRLAAGLKRKGIQIETGVMVKEISAGEEGLAVLAAGKKGEMKYPGEMVLVATGRTVNTGGLNLEGIGVSYTPKGIEVDSRYQTTVPGVYAIGDVIGGLMLAHVAAEEGIAAVEGIMGRQTPCTHAAVPSCVFTFPEVAAVGLTEEQAQEKNLEYGTSKFMFGANGKALAMGEGEGFVKVIAEKQTGKLLGVQIMGPHASDLIHEAALALTHNLTAAEIIHTVHAHPTLAEAFQESLLGLENRAIHLLPRRQISG